MINFLSFGSGSSGNSYLLQSETTCVLIDVGISFRLMTKHFKDLGLNIEQIDAIFITHDHADHFKALEHFTNKMNIPVYMTDGVYRGILNNRCLKNPPLPQNIHPIYKGVPVQMGDMLITPFDVPHDSTDCVGYTVQQGEVVFNLITDVGHVTPLIEEKVRQSHYLVLEANHDKEMLRTGPYPQRLKERIVSPNGHLSNDETAYLLASHATPELKHVWLCHLSEKNNHPSLVEKTVESILKSHGIIVGVDFEVEVLKRNKPSRLYHLA